MAATLTAAGITFSDSTQINSKYGIFPKNSAVVFYQASAPTGWTTEPTVHNNKALRVVSGTAANSGGNQNFTACFANSRPFSANVPVSINSTSGGNHTLTTPQLPSHNHSSNNGPNISAAGGGTLRVANAPNAQTTGNQGNNGAHNHPLTANAANGPISSNFNFGVQYVNVIYCKFS